MPLCLFKGHLKWLIVYVAAYSCHGRWLDAEGTQFVIATPLARRTSWTSENNKLQPYRNTRRLCFMYRESGGVVSLTASSVACQRGFPRSPPMLAFNATSIGKSIVCVCVYRSHFFLQHIQVQIQLIKLIISPLRKLWFVVKLNWFLK